MSKLKKVEPKPFGRLGLVAMSKKEHDSIGDWSLQQKRRRQLNELQRRAYTGIPTPVTGVYDDNKPSLIECSFFRAKDWSNIRKDLR